MPKTKVKYYAVRNGKNIGIYETWEECQKQILGYSSAQYKSFKTRDQAEEYLDGKEAESLQLFDSDADYIFCDGSEIKGEGIAGCGVYYPSSEITYYKDLAGMTNNQAELLAIDYSLDLIIKKDQDQNQKYIIISDSEYSINALTVWLDNWKINQWKNSKNKQIENYSLIVGIDKKLSEISSTLRSRITFQHQPSHQSKPSVNNKMAWFLWNGNEIADLLAKGEVEKARNLIA